MNKQFTSWHQHCDCGIAKQYFSINVPRWWDLSYLFSSRRIFVGAQFVLWSRLHRLWGSASMKISAIDPSVSIIFHWSEPRWWIKLHHTIKQVNNVRSFEFRSMGFCSTWIQKDLPNWLLILGLLHFYLSKCFESSHNSTNTDKLMIHPWAWSKRYEELGSVRMRRTAGHSNDSS